MDPEQIIENMKNQLNKPMEEAMATGLSEIAKFYENKTIFLTGGSGFLGKQLIEKLFRCCNIKKAYVLIRNKKGKTTEERLQEMLSDAVFEDIRKKDPLINSKIVGITGDVTELELGINKQDWNTITEEVEIIVNLAATIRFDEKIKQATLVNIRGTRETLKLAKNCKNIVCFIHVSTAYSNATSTLVGDEVFERFYPTPVDPEAMIDLVLAMDEDRLNGITPSLIESWPNTYTFTKAIAEDLVRTEAKGLPVAIVRPSIVLHTYREPVPAWLDNTCIYGPTGFVFGVGLGVLRVMYVRSTSKLAFVPVDLVNNATIAAGWEVSRSKTDEPVIYNVSSTNAGVTFRHVSVPMRKNRVRQNVSPKCIWYCYLIETSNETVYWILSWLLHKIPAHIVDSIVKIFNIKMPKEVKSLVEVYTKIDKMKEIFSFFLLNEWNFNDTNLIKLSKKMSDVDRKIFNFDIHSVNWDDYTLFWVLGIRKYIVKDGLKYSKEAVRKQFWFKIANAMIVLLYVYLFWRILSFFFHLLF